MAFCVIGVAEIAWRRTGGESAGSMLMWYRNKEKIPNGPETENGIFKGGHNVG